MAAISVGSVAVSVIPSVRNFSKDLQRKLVPEAKVVGDEVGKTLADSINARLRGVNGVNLDVNNKLANAKIDETAAKADELGRKRPTVSVGVDKASFGFLTSKIGLAVAGLASFGPAAGVAAAGLAGAGVALGSAAVAAGAFGAVAIPMFKAAQKGGKGLTASEKELRGELVKTEGEWGRLQKAMQPVVESSFDPWFKTVDHAMSFLPSLIRPAAGAIFQLGDEARKALAAPFWGRFFAQVGDSGAIALEGFGGAVGYVADGLAHLFLVFKPWIDKLPGLINNWAASFDHWARSYNGSGFSSFMDYVKKQGPAIKSIFKSLGELLPKITTAFQGMPTVTLNAFADLLSVAAKMTPGQIQALAYLYTASKLSALSGTVSGKVAGRQGNGAVGGAEAGLAAGGLLSKGRGLLGKGIGLVGQSGIQTLIARALTSAIPQASPGALKAVGSGGALGNIARAILGPGANNLAADLHQYYQVPIRNFFTKTLPDWIKTSAAAKAASSMAGVAATIGSGFVTGWHNAYGAISKAVGSVRGAITGAFKGARGWLSNAGNSIAYGFGQAWSASSKWVKSMFGRGYSWVMSQFGNAGKWLSRAGNSIAGGLGGAWNATAKWVRSQFGRGYGWVMSQFGNAGKWLSKAGNAVAYGLGQAWNATSKWVRGQFGRGYSWVLSQFANAARWLSKAGNAIAGGLGGAWNAAKGWVVRQFGKGYSWVLSQFGTAGKWLWNKGRDVIDGLWGGMKSIWSKVTGWIKSLAGWIKKHKGPIPLDAQLLVPNGKALMSGLERGLKQGWGPIGSLVKSAAGKISSAFADAGNWFSKTFDLGGGGGISAAGVANSSAYAALRSAAAKMGWNGAQWNALNYVEMREAGYNPTIRNPSSGAYGLAQGITGPSWYYGYGGNPNTVAGQATAMVNYIRQRYGNPENAAAHERAYNWYDKGGYLPPGASMVYNGTGKPEPVFTDQQWKALESGTGAGVVNTFNMTMPEGSTVRNFVDQFGYAIRRQKMAGVYG